MPNYVVQHRPEHSFPFLVTEDLYGLELGEFQTREDAVAFTQSGGLILRAMHSKLIEKKALDEGKVLESQRKTEALFYKIGDPLVFSTGEHPHRRIITPVVTMRVAAHLPDLIASFHQTNPGPPEQGGHSVDYFITWLVLNGMAVRRDPIHIDYTANFELRKELLP